MKKTILKAISFILVLAQVVVALPVQALAAGNNELDVLSGVSYVNTGETVEATAAEVEESLMYTLHFNTNMDDSEVFEAVTTNSEVIGTQTIGEKAVVEYSVDYTARHLYNCKDVVEVTLIGEILYIGYNTVDNKYVSMAYTEFGLQNTSVYENDTDTAIYLSESGSLKYENFRYGQSISLSEELIEDVHALLQMDEIETLQNIEGLEVVTRSDGSVIIEPDIDYFRRNQDNARLIVLVNLTEQEMLQELLYDLEENFPQITNKLVASSTKHCSYLNATRGTWVTQSRNSYVKKEANWRPFLIGTALTVIATYLSLPITVTCAMLTAGSVAIGANDVLQTDISLSRSAKYEFFADISGVVYDTTVYNDRVQVLWYVDSGELAGGYDPDGVFRWIVSEAPAIYDMDTSEIMELAMSEYNSCLIMNSSNTMYPPITITY